MRQRGLALAAFFFIAGSVLLNGSVSAAETVKGEVVDLACYMGHGASGSGHQSCAQKCMDSGLPVGIKTTDGLVIAIGSEHSTANSSLRALAGKNVSAEGAVSSRDGVKMIAIQKVTAEE